MTRWCRSKKWDVLNSRQWEFEVMTTHSSNSGKWKMSILLKCERVLACRRARACATTIDAFFRNLPSKNYFFGVGGRTFMKWKPRFEIREPRFAVKWDLRDRHLSLLLFAGDFGYSHVVRARIQKETNHNVNKPNHLNSLARNSGFFQTFDGNILFCFPQRCAHASAIWKWMYDTFFRVLKSEDYHNSMLFYGVCMSRAVYKSLK